MDISVQRFQEFGGGFSDDSQYGNFLGIHGKKYYAQKREEQAKQTAVVEAQAAAEAKKNADAVQAEALKKLEEAKRLQAEALAKVPQTPPTTTQTVGTGAGGTTQSVVVDATTPTPEAPKSNKMLIIGGVAIVGVVAIVLLMRK